MSEAEVEAVIRTLKSRLTNKLSARGGDPENFVWEPVARAVLRAIEREQNNTDKQEINMTEIEDVQARLAEMDDAYENVTDGRPEEGTYQAVIERFDFFDSKKTGDLFMKTFLKIAHDPQYEGYVLEAIHNLTDMERIRWTKKYLAVLGYTGSISGLIGGNLDSLVGLPVEVAVKYSTGRLDEYGDPYMNVFVNRRLAELAGPVGSDVPADTSGFSPAGGGVDTDSVPF